ncbi:MAG: hypothetical protein ACLR06_13775 [Christensenellaceae bacterium]
MPETELSGGKTDGAPVTDASVSAEGVALTHKGGGAYTLKIEKDYVASFAEGKSVSVLSGGFRTEIQVLYISVAFDGRAEQSDGYSPAFSFLTTDSQSQNNEATVHVKSTATGVAFAIVMASPYINQTGSASGQNGGGLEIRMANSPDASTGLWWRVFSDGTARQETNLNAGAPSAERYASPVGSSAFAVGLVPNDENDLTKGYKQMTLEFFVSYGARRRRRGGRFLYRRRPQRDEKERQRDFGRQMAGQHGRDQARLGKLVFRFGYGKLFAGRSVGGGFQRRGAVQDLCRSFVSYLCQGRKLC